MNVLRKKRIDAKLGVRGLAKLSGVNKDTIVALESGKNNANPVTLARLAEHLGCQWEDLSELLTQKEIKAPKLQAANSPV